MIHRLDDACDVSQPVGLEVTSLVHELEDPHEASKLIMLGRPQRM